MTYLTVCWPRCIVLVVILVVLLLLLPPGIVTVTSFVGG